MIDSEYFVIGVVTILVLCIMIWYFKYIAGSSSHAGAKQKHAQIAAGHKVAVCGDKDAHLLKAVYYPPANTKLCTKNVSKMPGILAQGPSGRHNVLHYPEELPLDGDLVVEYRCGDKKEKFSGAPYTGRTMPRPDVYQELVYLERDSPRQLPRGCPVPPGRPRTDAGVRVDAAEVLSSYVADRPI